MAILQKIDSNVTGLAYAEEVSLGLLAQEQTSPTQTVWYTLKPNSYADFGGEVEEVASEPIDPSRQNEPGSAVGVEATGGFNQDLAISHPLQNLFQGFFFASTRRKGTYGLDLAENFSLVDAATDEYRRAAGDWSTIYRVGDLIFATGFSNAANNGLKRIITVTATTIGVAEALVDETPAAGVGQLTIVGFQFGSGEVTIDVTGSFPRLVRTGGTKDLTQFSLVDGQAMWVGGDSAPTQFAVAVSNGRKRVRSVTATEITFDKSDSEMLIDAGASKTIQIFFGHVQKNEVGTTILRRTYRLQRTLGAPDTAQPTQLQAQYLKAAVPNTLTINYEAKSKATFDLGFVALDETFVEAGSTLQSDDANAVVVESPVTGILNTSTDIKRIRLATITDGVEAPTPLFAFAQNLTLEIDNGITGDEALGVFGFFEATAANFVVSGSLTAYFANVSAQSAIRNSADITLDIWNVKTQTGAVVGVVADLPLLRLGDGRANVSKDEPITLPLTLNASRGRGISTNLDHTLMFTYFDYLPAAAAA